MREAPRSVAAAVRLAVEHDDPDGWWFELDRRTAVAHVGSVFRREDREAAEVTWLVRSWQESGRGRAARYAVAS